MNEVENTARRLREEPLLVTSFWCRLHWHNWTKWNDPHHDKAHVDYVQYRMCIHCNAYGMRRVRPPL